MKKVCLLLIILFAPLLVLGKEYDIKDVDLKLSLDDNWYVFTRDNLDNNNGLKELELDKDYVYNTLVNNKAYVDAFPKDIAFEFFVIVPNENLDMHNLSNYPDEMIDKEIGKIIGNIPDAKYNIVKIGNYKYLEISFLDNNTSQYLYRYYTVVNAKAVSFQIQKKEAFSDDEKVLLKDIVSKSEFNIKEEYQKENSKIQEGIDDYGKSKFDIKRILIGALTGAVLGGISSIILKFVKKKEDKNKAS